MENSQLKNQLILIFLYRPPITPLLRINFKKITLCYSSLVIKNYKKYLYLINYYLLLSSIFYLR